MTATYRKQQMLAMVALLGATVLVSIPALAESRDRANPPIENYRQLSDGATAYETIDPFGNRVTVVIDPPAPKVIDNSWDRPESPDFRGYEVDEAIAFPNNDAVTATVSVYAVADEEYRAQYANWTNKLYNIIETADNAYYRDFGINWVISGYYSWTSNGGNSSAILSDLASDGSGLPRGLCMGFTRDSNFTAGGIAYVYGSDPGTGYSVCLDQGNTSTVYALRHEIGHNYGASHDFDPVVCLMNYTYSYSIDYFDGAHNSLINSHTSWF